MSRYAGTKKRGKSWSYYIYVMGKKRWVGGFATQREAWLAKAEAEAKKERGRYLDRSPTTLKIYIENFWLPSLAGQQLKSTTIAQYAEKVRYALDALGDRPVQDIQSLDVERLRSDLLDRGLSPRTVTLALVTLSLALDHAQNIGNLITENPCRKVKKPRSRPKPRGVLTIDQMRRIEQASKDGQWESFIRLAFYTGARRGELLGLRWSDIDLDAQTVTFSVNAVEVEGQRSEHTTKSDEPRTVTLDDETVAILRRCKAQQNVRRLSYGQYWNETELVVANNDGSAPLPKSATHAWSRLMKKAGVRGFRLHDARHAHATYLLSEGTPLHVVADRLGHKDSGITSVIYAHVLKKQEVGAADTFAEVMKRNA